MRKIGIIFWLVSFAILAGTATADSPKNKFYDKPGTYKLGDSGNLFSIKETKSGECELKLSYADKQSTIGASTDQKMIGSDWFVFVESPSVIWYFNGKEEYGVKFTQSGSSIKIRSMSWLRNSDVSELAVKKLPDSLQRERERTLKK